MIQNNLIHEGERLDELQREMDMESSRIRRVSVLAWTLCCYPVLRKQRQGKKYWILEPAPELFRF